MFKTVKSNNLRSLQMTFKEQIQQGISNELPNVKTFEAVINHAP